MNETDDIATKLASVKLRDQESGLPINNTVSYKTSSDESNKFTLYRNNNIISSYTMEDLANVSNKDAIIIEQDKLNKILEAKVNLLIHDSVN